MIDNVSPIDLVPAVVSWASRQSIIDRIYFFGSRVRGEHKLASDLDIAVQLIYSDPAPALAHWFSEGDNWVSQLSDILPWEPDLQLLAPGATPTISAGIEESAMLVYQRPAGGLVDGHEKQ